jgi:hypothetical protein
MSATNLPEFVAGLQRFAAELKPVVKHAAEETAIALHDRIVELTPYDSGAAKASWNMSLDNPDEAVAAGQFTEAEAEAMAKQTQAVLASYDPDVNVIVVSNSLPYIEDLEEGSSDQAPGGMTGLALAEAEVEAVFRGLLAGRSR